MSIRHTVLIAALASWQLLVAACSAGDDDDDTSYDCSFSACGGDLVGSWTPVATCDDAPPQSPVPECPAATYVVEFALTGSQTFAADGTLTQVGTRSATYASFTPFDCLAASDAAACEALHQDVFGAAGTCAAVDGGCDCTGPFLAETAIDATGTWSTDGSRVTMTLDGVGTFEGDYCVDGDVAKSRIDGVASTSVALRAN